MNHFPIFLATAGRRVVVSGGGAAALAKLRLLLKTEAEIRVFAADPDPAIVAFARVARLSLIRRTLRAGDVTGAALFYAADEDPQKDARTAAIARAEGALVNIVDNLDDSAFITPAIVDRDPVTVAIGTEGAAPVLARKIKRDLEDRLPARLGMLARIAKAFRPRAESLPAGAPRRAFWADYFARSTATDEPQARATLDSLLERHLARAPRPGLVEFTGAGPGDPDLLTIAARRALDRADVVIHDRLVAPEILELARREAVIVDAGKTGFGPATPQQKINAMIVEHGRRGAHVVRLKSGDPTVFGRLDEEIEAVEAARLDWRILPGITAASAAAAEIGQSLTRRGRNHDLRIVTGHDMQGFAEQDWHALARPGAVAAVYMGKRAARFLQGRLLMHGADRNTPVTLVENAARTNQRIEGATLATLPDALDRTTPTAPAVILLGLAPRQAATLSIPEDITREFA